MKRLLLGLAAFSFLAFVGLEATHVHKGAVHQDCQLCVLGAQSIRHAPTTVAAPAPNLFSETLPQKPKAKPRASCHRESPARGPPKA